MFVSEVHREQKLGRDVFCSDDGRYHTRVWICDLDCGEDEESLGGFDLKFDDDGDVILANRRRSRRVFVNLVHKIESDLDSVGCQLWNGSLTLARNIHELMPRTGGVLLEMGCGVGLVGVAAMLVKKCHVIFTDINAEALSLARRNCEANVPGVAADFLSFDWDSDEAQRERLFATISRTLTRSPGDLVVVAADCVYDDQATSALVNFLAWLAARCHHLSPPRIFVSVERREVFTVKHLGVTAPALAHFHRAVAASSLKVRPLLHLDQGDVRCFAVGE